MTPRGNHILGSISESSNKSDSAQEFLRVITYSASLNTVCALLGDFIKVRIEIKEHALFP